CKDVHIVMADLHIRRKEWSKAINRIETAIALKPKKKIKTRLYFILAQIQQQTGNAEGANASYTKVIRMNPDYEMTFYAKINRALAGGGNREELKKELLAMVRDEKNAEYLDQIYYALADIELQENNKSEGIAYLEKSAKASKENLHQKTKTYLRLADIYFEDKKYEPAQSYYDSTARVVPKDHPQYDIIKAKHKSLTTLVEHIQTIALEDSLQKLGNLTVQEQEELVQNLIEDLKAEEERKREEAIQKQIDEALNNANAAAKGGKFWVYSPQLKGAGFADFKGKWGDRKNEDNWRRANKEMVLVDNFIENPEVGDSTNANLAAKYNPATYLKNIPKTPADYKKSDEKIMTALYGEGVVYKDDLKDFAEAVTSFQSLLDRFPTAKLAPASLYQLFRIGNLSNFVNGDIHKIKLLNEFPSSKYAQLIKDPKYLEKQQKELDKLKDEYESYYKDYRNRNFQRVILKANEVANDSTIGEYRCKYLYLKALSIGNISPPSINPAPFEKALSDVIKSCKGSDVAGAAQKTLDLIKNKNSVTNANDGTSTYIYSSSDQHFFLYIHDKEEGSANPAKAKISNFNGSSFSSKGLITSTNFLDEGHQIILVKSFKNKAEAIDYYTAFKLNTGPLKKFNQKDNFYVITGKNYASLLLEKSDTKYKKFFKENYLD
ncbi:MAG: tetratricopeptide repeat protein, partial [Flavobacteriales bacterium]|nr:tetratricopeptide repeat protein [Flavobacteriales bacterium]